MKNPSKMLIFTLSFLLHCLILSTGNKLPKFHSYLARLDGHIYCKGPLSF